MTTNFNPSLEAFEEKGRGFAIGEGKGVQMKKSSFLERMQV